MASKTLTIEVGNEFIKITEIQRNKNKVMVHNAISVQTPSDTVEDGFVKDITSVAETIRNAMLEEKIVAKEVTFVLNSSRVATKEVILPLVKREKVQELVNANASDYFPVNIDDYVLSYTILEERKTKEEQKSRILVFAAPSAIVESYYNLAVALGMKVKAVDYAGNSTLQLIKIQIDEKPTLIVQIGMDTTIVSIMSNNILQLQRTIPYGESLLLNAVIESKRVSSRVALELLSTAQMVKESIDKDEVTGSLKYLVSNVNRVIEYYTGRNTEAPLQKILIIGDGADVLGMDTLFINETSLPTERLTLLKNVESYNRIKVSTSKMKQYMANIGAALDPIHLQPKTAKLSSKEQKQPVNMMPYIGAMAAMIAVAVIIAIFPIVKYENAKSERNDVQHKIDKLSGIYSISHKYYEAKAKYDDINSFYLSTANNEEGIMEFLSTLEYVMPTDMYLTQLDSTDGKAVFTGVCSSKAEVAALQTAIEKSEKISSVATQVVLEPSDTHVVKFTMQAAFYTDDGALAEAQKETKEGAK